MNWSHRLKPRELCCLYLEPAAVYTKTPPLAPPPSPRIKQKGWTAPWKRLRGKTGMMRRGKRTKAITRGGESGERKTNGEMIKCSVLLIPHFSNGAKKIAPSPRLSFKSNPGRWKDPLAASPTPLARMHRTQRKYLSVPSCSRYLFSPSFVNSLKVPVKFHKSSHSGK